jgi:hypothetical protein
VTPVVRWLRGNLWALIALAVLATASIWYAFAFDWQSYQDGRPTQPIEVPAGAEGELGGGDFAIERLTVLAGDSDEGRRYDVTEGTDVVVVDLRITPRPDGDPDDFIGCDVRLRAPSPDGEREWWPETSNPTTYPEPEPEAYGCDIAAGPAYTYRQYFVVPAGGAEDGVVQITIREELPRALRLHW